MTRNTLIVLATAAVLSATASSQTSSNPPAPAADASPMPSSDRDFLVEVARGGRAEIELGKLAAKKASRPEVQAFGQHMVDDHGKANEDLEKLAASTVTSRKQAIAIGLSEARRSGGKVPSQAARRSRSSRVPKSAS